jgi:hypothetical protein
VAKTITASGGGAVTVAAGKLVAGGRLVRLEVIDRITTDIGHCFLDADQARRVAALLLNAAARQEAAADGRIER